MCDASKRQLEQLLVAPAWKTQHQEKVMGLSACDAKVTFELAGASMRWVHPKELLHPQIGTQRGFVGVIALLKAAESGRWVPCGQKSNWS